MEQYSPQYGTGYTLLVRSLTPWDIIRQSIHSPQLVSEVTNIIAATWIRRSIELVTTC